MKFYTFLLSICLGVSSYAQIDIKVSGNIFNAQTDSVYIAQFFGTHYVNHLGAKLNKDGTFEVSGKVPEPDYYVLRIGKTHVNLVLRNGADIIVYGDGNNLSEFLNIVNSEESSNMYKYIQVVEKWTKKSDSATRVIKQNPEKGPEINREMGAEYQRFQGELKSFIARNSGSAALYAAVSSIDPKQDFATYDAVVNKLIISFGDSPSIKALQNKHALIKKEMLANDKMAPGKLAPDFEEMMPDGSTMKLSDLRGKVVLLDFWASWCGPCRKENPNVVKVYNEYKDKGFTVMSVSLDKAKPNWLAAIEKDNLSWPYHVSDLKHWGSKVAKIYGVSGIPFTVLIDQEGKIIRTKLRGADLEKELARILGDK